MAIIRFDIHDGLFCPFSTSVRIVSKAHYFATVSATAVTYSRRSSSDGSAQPHALAKMSVERSTSRSNCQEYLILLLQ